MDDEPILFTDDISFVLKAKIMDHDTIEMRTELVHLFHGGHEPDIRMDQISAPFGAQGLHHVASSDPIRWDYQVFVGI